LHNIWRYEQSTVQNINQLQHNEDVYLRLPLIKCDSVDSFPHVHTPAYTLFLMDQSIPFHTLRKSDTMERTVSNNSITVDYQGIKITEDERR